MTDYSCRGYIRFVFVGMLLVFGGAFTAFFLEPVLNTGGVEATSQRLAGMFPLGLLFGGAAFAGLWGLLWSFTVFRLDESGIVKRWWNGATQQFVWRELVRVEPTQDGSGTLTDCHGNRMTIPSAEFKYRSKSGQSLYAALGEHIARLPEEIKAALSQQSEFRFGQSAPALAAGFMVLLCIAGAVAFPFMPHSGPPAPLAATIGISGFFLFGALFMAYFGLQQATRVLTLTDTGVIDRSVFGKREISFDQVLSLTTKEMPAKSGSIEVTTVKSATTTIYFSALLPNYDILVQAIRAKVGAQVPENAPQAVQAETKRYLLLNCIGLFFIGCLFGAGFGGLGVTMLHDGQAALARQSELDTHGKRTTGEAIGVEKTGSKTTFYSLNYTFQVDGRSYSHSSSVSREVYDQQPIGGTVSVDYLPNDPEVSRVTVSIAKAKAEDKMHAAKMMFLLACLLPILLPALALTQKPRYRSTSGLVSSR